MNNLPIIPDKKEESISQEEKIDSFFRFCKERQKIYLAKERGEQQPWTQDRFLRKYKFCNVYREQDRGTKYYLEEVLPHCKTENQIVYLTYAYRLCNRPEAFEKIKDGLIDPWKIVFGEKDMEGVFFGSAYLVLTGLEKGADKREEYKESVIDAANMSFEIVGALKNCQTAEESYQVVQRLPHVGKFIAFQIWLDLLMTPLLSRFTEDDFVVLGPGAEQGLEIIYGKGDLELLKELQHLQVRHGILKTLTLCNIEFALCEFRKYWNLWFGRGKKKYYTQKT